MNVKKVMTWFAVAALIGAFVAGYLIREQRSDDEYACRFEQMGDRFASCSTASYMPAIALAVIGVLLLFAANYTGKRTPSAG